MAARPRLPEHENLPFSLSGRTASSKFIPVQYHFTTPFPCPPLPVPDTTGYSASGAEATENRTGAKVLEGPRVFAEPAAADVGSRRWRNQVVASRKAT